MNIQPIQARFNHHKIKDITPDDFHIQNWIANNHSIRNGVNVNEEFYQNSVYFIYYYRNGIPDLGEPETEDEIDNLTEEVHVVYNGLFKISNIFMHIFENTNYDNTGFKYFGLQDDYVHFLLDNFHEDAYLYCLYSHIRAPKAPPKIERAPRRYNDFGKYGKSKLYRLKRDLKRVV